MRPAFEERRKGPPAGQGNDLAITQFTNPRELSALFRLLDRLVLHQLPQALVKARVVVVGFKFAGGFLELVGLGWFGVGHISLCSRFRRSGNLCRV